MKFCVECGTQLGIICNKCGTQNEEDSKFCIECGTSFESAQEQPVSGMDKNQQQSQGRTAPNSEPLAVSKQRSFRKKLGIVMIIVGLVGVIAFQGGIESNQPMYVSTSLGSGYMGGLSSQTTDMLNGLTVLGVIEIIAGFLFLIF